MANLSEAFRERCWHTSCLQHCLFVCFLLIFIGVQLLCNVVLVPAVQQREAAICRHSSPLFWISFPFRSHRASRRVLCRALGSRWLSVLYIAVVSTSAALCTREEQVLATVLRTADREGRGPRESRKEPLRVFIPLWFYLLLPAHQLCAMGKSVFLLPFSGLRHSFWAGGSYSLEL